MQKAIVYMLIVMCCFSCAIHDKFPYICFYSQCVKQQFSLKTLKHNMQIAFGGKKKKHPKSTKSTKGVPVKKPSVATGTGNNARADSLVTDSIPVVAAATGFGIQDTVIRISYSNLTDSMENFYRNLVHSYIKRCGKEKISEVHFTDVYAEDGTEEESIYATFRDFIISKGISRHKIFKGRNRYLKKSESIKSGHKLLFLEIHFH